MNHVALMPNQKTRGQPTWEVAYLFPTQGNWSEEDYLWLSEQTNRLVEYPDGYIEVLPMPTDRHQAVMQFLLFALSALIEPAGGKVRIEGKDYVMQDGDVVEFRFNV